MSVNRNRDEDVWSDVDLEEGSVQIRKVVETVVEIDDLFHCDQLTLWSDSHGWSGFEIRDGDFWRVNYSAIDNEYITQEQVSREAVIERIKEHIHDPKAGGVGEFERGANP